MQSVSKLFPKPNLFIFFSREILKKDDPDFKTYMEKKEHLNDLLVNQNSIVIPIEESNEVSFLCLLENFKLDINTFLFRVIE